MTMRMQDLPPATRHNPPFSIARVGAMVLRYWYLLKGSWPRMLELAYWPAMNLVMWGFLQTFLAQTTNVFAQAGGVLVGSVLLWELMFRGQLGFTISFFEEMWSRNFGHLMVTPLRPSEFVAALVSMSIIRTIIGMTPALAIAIWFFGFNLFDLGIVLIAFFANLVVFGWAVALVVTGIILRNGLGAESLAWAVPFIFVPLCGIYYPVTVMPDWLEAIALCLPPTYVFEGMRSILFDQVIDWSRLAFAAGLNIIYFCVGYAIFMMFLRAAKERGMLLTIGE
jgi:ABC-2 type transport system permease protein